MATPRKRRWLTIVKLFYLNPKPNRDMKTDKYILRKISNELLFYVDRSKTKAFWWSYDLNFAMVFTSKDEAEKIASRLRYGQFEVITLREAVRLRNDRDNQYEDERMNSFDPHDYEHPFSSEALGQD